MSNKKKSLKEEIINIGKKLYDLRLVVGRIGNLSAKLNDDNILITATGTCLGDLKYKDIIKVSLTEKVDRKIKPVSSEFPLHRLIYKKLKTKTIIHCHPPLVNAYFSIYPSLKVQTPETKFYLGNVPVVRQDTLTIKKAALVVNALKKNNLVVVKNHGVVSIADKFEDGLNLIEILEEAVKIGAVARLFKKKALDSLDKELKRDLTRKFIR